MAPVNIAGQPILAVRELRQQGVDASLLQYTFGKGGHPFGYPSDRFFDLKGRPRLEAQFEALRSVLEEGYDIFHFWMAPLFVNKGFEGFHGLDLPFIKARGIRIVYRGTGFDLRARSLHCARNPYHPYRYGFEGVVDEHTHRLYVDYLKDYVDLFIVQDPEMHEHMPEARIIPRGIDLDHWPEVGVERNGRPLVVHAPSRGPVKGTQLVVEAVKELQNAGLEFDFQLIEGMPHREAVEWYRRADIVVDQLLLGWYGVLTIESLALGKPVLVYVRDDLYESFSPRIPIHNANPDTITERLRELITDHELRDSLAERARPYVEQVHDIRKVAASLRSAYEDVMRLPVRMPETFADLNYFLSRYTAVEAREERALTASKARKYDRILPELKRIRFKSNKYDALLGQLPQLRAKAKKYDRLRSWIPTLRKAEELGELAAELERLRGKAAEYDRLAEELKSLRFKAAKHKALAAEVVELRAKATEYDRLAQELNSLRFKAARAKTLPEELDEVRARAREHDRLAETLKSLRFKAAKNDALAREIEQLRSAAEAHDSLAEEVKSLRFKVAKNEALATELADLGAKVRGRRRLTAKLDVLWRKRRRSSLAEELSDLRERLREYDRLAAELKTLRFKAARREALAAEIEELRAKATEHDLLAEELKQLRHTVGRHGRSADAGVRKPVRVRGRDQR